MDRILLATVLFALWIVVVEERRWTCSELVMNYGPDSSHFLGTTTALYKSVVQMDRKLPVVTEMSVAVICLTTEQISPWLAFRGFFLGALSPLAVSSHSVLNCHLPSTSPLSVFEMTTTCFWTEHSCNQSLSSSTTVFGYFMSSGSVVIARWVRISALK